MTMLEDITAGLGDDAQNWPQAAVERVLRAERAAQASRVHYDGERPPALDEALLARVRYNLEETGGTEPVTRIGIRGPGVRELELPFTHRGAFEANAAAAQTRPTAAPRSARARKTTAATKATAKKASGN